MNYVVKVLVNDKWLYISEGPIDDLRVCKMTMSDAENYAIDLAMDGFEGPIQIEEYND